jgi:2-C-methyl-D-erythritol 2,4-cyclodiphosphate synthase
MSHRVGFGYDSHRFGADRPLILGGETLEHTTGLIGHSDGDAICHAITDALLGAAALGDIGRHFPDTDPDWKNADSIKMLNRIGELLSENGFRIINVDATVVTEAPKIAPHADKMRANVGRCLSIPKDHVSIKGKTSEGMDAAGKGEGLIVHAVAAIESV